MLLSALLLSVILNLVFSLVFLSQEKRWNRALERRDSKTHAREDELIQNILLLKGYREQELNSWAANKSSIPEAEEETEAEDPWEEL